MGTASRSPKSRRETRGARLSAQTDSDSLIIALTAGPGYWIKKSFLNTGEVAALLADFTDAKIVFKLAGIGADSAGHVESDVRRDEISWFEPEALSAAQDDLWKKLDVVRLELNEALYLNLIDVEGHYAHYFPGGFYKKHLDRFRTDDARTISIIVYLNPYWVIGDGGELLIFDGEKILEKVEPLAGTIVCFMSDRIEHEVATSVKDRRSFAGWMRQRKFGDRDRT